MLILASRVQYYMRRCQSTGLGNTILLLEYTHPFIHRSNWYTTYSQVNQRIYLLWWRNWFLAGQGHTRLWYPAVLGNSEWGGNHASILSSYVKDCDYDSSYIRRKMYYWISRSRVTRWRTFSSRPLRGRERRVCTLVKCHLATNYFFFTFRKYRLTE